MAECSAINSNAVQSTFLLLGAFNTVIILTQKWFGSVEAYQMYPQMRFAAWNHTDSKLHQRYQEISSVSIVSGDRSDMVIAAEVARSLGFPPLLVELADEVLRHVTDHGKRPFNGLHLRLEGDIMHVISSLGGIEVRYSINIFLYHRPEQKYSMLIAPI